MVLRETKPNSITQMTKATRKYDSNDLHDSVVVVSVVVVVLLVDVGIAVVVVVAVVVVGSVAASLHEPSRSFCKTLFSELKLFAKKKYSGFDATFRNSSLSTPAPTPTVKIVMPSAFVLLASSCVRSASRVAVPSVSMMRIFGTPSRAPMDVLNIERPVLNAAARFVCPPSR